MLRIQISLPPKSNALRMPVPVMTQTRLPSVTGDGDDMFCFIIRRFPPPSGRFHRTVPFERAIAQSDSSLLSPTFSKTESPHTMGVEPDHAGVGSFQEM